ncbi:MAG: histidinol-phosphate/aromatic aminotransferase/cobyric acid decarboxylase-like protein, partial [Neolewinella sp.]
MSAAIGYSPPTFAGGIHLDLSKNEGRVPRDESLLQAIPSIDQLARYPALRELQSEMAASYGVPMERVLVTAGGDDALLRLCLLALRRSRQNPN